MACCRLVLPLLVLTVVQCYGESVPVFLWGDLAKPSLKSYPLITKSGEEFEYIAKKELHNEPFTVVFIEENLSVEDFSHKSSDGESAFPFLHSNIGDAVYIPSVENPLSVLKALANPDKVDYIELTEDGLSRKIEPESGRYLFISMKDALEGESRMDLLRRHNDFMEALFVQLQGRFNMLAAVYTAQNPSWTVTEHQRARRQANENATESIYKGRDIAIPSLRLYVDKVYLDNNDILPSYTTGSNKLENTTQQSTLNFQNDTWKGALTLNFVVENGYWLLDNITLNSEGNGTQYTETLEPVTSVYSLESNSYRCIPNVTYVTVNETRSFKVTFQNLKVQPFFNDTADPDSLVFGDSYNCVGFFSIPIWSGLFVVFILLSIVFYGIMMMMDIRTMDRFDDPKGKTITINTSE